MKNITYILSSVSNFFNEKRFIHQMETGGDKQNSQPQPKKLSNAEFRKLTDRKLEDVLPVTNPDVKALSRITKKELEAAQAKGAALSKGAKEKFGYVRTDYDAAKYEAQHLMQSNKFSIKQEKNALTKLVLELGLTGSESNWQEGYKVKKDGKVVPALEKDVVRTIDRALKSLPDYKQLVATYHVLLEDGDAQKANQRRLEKEAKKQLMTMAQEKDTPANNQLWAVLQKFETKTGPVTHEKEVTAIAKKPTAQPTDLLAKRYPKQ